MGIYDILVKHGMKYNDLIELLQDLKGCVDYDVNNVITQLDAIYNSNEFLRDFMGMFEPRVPFSELRSAVICGVISKATHPDQPNTKIMDDVIKFALERNKEVL